MTSLSIASDETERTRPGEEILGGRLSRARFARLLGLAAGDPYRVTEVSGRGRVVHVRLTQLSETESGPAPATYDFFFEARRPDRRGLLSGAHLTLWHHGAVLPAGLKAGLARRTGPALARLRFEDLLAALRADPEHTSALEERAASAGVDERETVGSGPALHELESCSVPSTGCHALTAPAIYADFFAAQEVRRASGCDTVDIYSDNTLIAHGDFECSYCAVTVPAPRYHFLRLGVQESVRDVGRPRHARGRFQESASVTDTFSTDINETDVILGEFGGVARVLDHAAAHGEKDQLMCVGLCLPDVIGADLESVVARHPESPSKPLLFVPPAPRSWNWLAHDLLKTRRKRLDSEYAAAPNPRAINLIGFPDNQGTARLTALLAEFGVEVNTHVLPGLQLKAIARLPRAALDVYCPNVYWEREYGFLGDESPRPGLMPDGPFGLQGTKRFLRAVLAALEGERRAEAALEARFESAARALTAPWGARCRQAAEHRLGFAVPAHGVHWLLDSAHSWGLPLLETTYEMGFGLDLFVGAADAAAATAAADRLAGQLPDGARARVALHTFHSLPEMMAALRESECEALFSNFVFDWRVSRAGKMPFSTLEFEMGLEGALATVERLLTICRTPLYRRFREFLPETPRPGDSPPRAARALEER